MTTKQATLEQTLNYQPVMPRFGTSGVRALVSELTDLEIYCLTLGTLRYLESAGKLCIDAARVGSSLRIPIAGDLRKSTDRLLGATTRAIQDAGYDIDYLGKIPTPALLYYALQHGTASFMITGSHIPADRNGQKANRCDGEILKIDEPGIVEAVSLVRTQELGRYADISQFDQQGMLKEDYQSQLPAPNPLAVEMYRDRYRKVFPAECLSGTRVLFFQYAAVGRDLLPEILRAAGAEVVEDGRSDDFVPIDTEAISQQHLQMLAKLVIAHQQPGHPFHAVISTDGDSNRPLVIGVDGLISSGDELRFIPGDLLGIVVADALGADAVSVPISANPAVHEYFADHNLVTRKTRIGSPYVIASMQEALLQGLQRPVAWEANGGFLVGSDIEIDGSRLNKLPSRDAALPILSVLRAAVGYEYSIASLFDQFPGWYGKADLLDNFPRQTSNSILAAFQFINDSAVQAEFLEDHILLTDAQDGMVDQWNLADPRATELIAKRQSLEALFSCKLGFDGIRKLNVQDGIRCFFHNGDIAHVRPSGNAPQLRIYAHARTLARAEAIVDYAMQEPDGILRRLQRWIDERGSDG